MSPSPFHPFQKLKPVEPPVVEEAGPEEEPTPPVGPPLPPEPSPAPAEERPQPTVLVSAEDAYIHERMRVQPQTLEEVTSRVEVSQREGMHRLSLPDYFERYSYDCTQGIGCKAHPWKQFEVTFADGARLPRWEHDRTGKELVFRWVRKMKRALDEHLNLHGWTFVNARYFPDAPPHLFTANGGVEVGGDILMFLPVKKALAIRTAPGERSRALLRGRVHPTGKPGRVMMGSPENPHHYMPNVDAEAGEGETEPSAGALVEGRDF